MARWRKKPVVIEAVQLTTDHDSVAFLNLIGGANVTYDWTTGRLTIHTLEGDMIAEPGDWIITGIKGERYPCKPDIFLATYEPVEE